MRRTLCRLLLPALLLAFAVAVPWADAAKKHTFVYVHDSDDAGRVYGFELARSGTLTALPGSPFTTDELTSGCRGQCQTMAYSKKRKVLLTTNETGVTSWLVAKDGTLTEVAGSPFVAHDAIGIAVVETKKRAFVFVARDAGALSGFEIAKDGTLAPLAGLPFVVGTDLVGAVASKGRVLLIDESSEQVFAYIVAKDGTVTEANDSPADFAENGGAYSVHTDAKGKFVLVSGVDALEVRRFDKRTAAMKTITGGVLDLAGDGANGPAISKKGLVVSIPFGRDVSEDDLRVIRLDRKTGALTAVGGVQTLGMAEVSVYAWDLTGKILICASQENDVVGTFSIDQKTGAPSPLHLIGMSGAREVTDIEVVKR